MYPDSVSRVHFLFVLIYGKSGFFIKFVKTYSISIKMGEHICSPIFILIEYVFTNLIKNPDLP